MEETVCTRYQATGQHLFPIMEGVFSVSTANGFAVSDGLSVWLKVAEQTRVSPYLAPAQVTHVVPPGTASRFVAAAPSGCSQRLLMLRTEKERGERRCW